MTMRFILTGFLLVLIRCAVTGPGDIDNLNGGRIFIIGHGGSGFQEFDSPWPANSLTSVTRAIDGMNADGVEVDVQMSADSVVMLYHDADLQSQTDGDGPVWQHASEYLLDRRYRRNFNTNLFQDEHLVSLETVLKRYSSYDPHPLIFLDVKLNDGRLEGSTGPYDGAFARAIVRLIRQYGMQDAVYVESVSVGFLRNIRQNEPGIRLLMKSGDFDYALQNAVIHSFCGIEMSTERISGPQVQMAHESGLWVALQGVKYQAGAIETIEKHPEIIQTDNILLLQQILH